MNKILFEKEVIRYVKRNRATKNIKIMALCTIKMMIMVIIIVIKIVIVLTVMVTLIMAAAVKTATLRYNSINKGKFNFSRVITKNKNKTRPPWAT